MKIEPFHKRPSPTPEDTAPKHRDARTPGESNSFVLNACVGKLGVEPPKRDVAVSVLRHVVARLADEYEELSATLDAMKSNTCIADMRLSNFWWDYLDRGKVYLQEFRKEFPSGTIFDVTLPTDDGEAYHIVLLVPGSEGNEVKTVHMKRDILHWEEHETGPSLRSGQFSADLDIRQVLGSYGCLRLGIVLAGSPGWDGASKETTTSKNEGNLVASWNDCNVMLQQILALSPDDRLYGTTCLGVVQTRRGFFGLLKYIFIDKWERQRQHDAMEEEARRTGQSIFDLMAHDEFHSLGDEGKLTGCLATDAFLATARISQVGLTEILPGGGMMAFGGYGVPDSDRLVPVDAERFACAKGPGEVDKYILIHYSGHGSLSGDIQIERNESITPEELADFSKEKETIFVLILDMCNSARFARRFGERLGQIGWKGVVFAANDESTSNGAAFESKIMAKIRRLSWPVEINEPNWRVGRGVYTSAFALGLLLIYEAETTTGVPYTVSLRAFNEELLQITCKMFALNYRIPLQKPMLYCYL